MSKDWYQDVKDFHVKFGCHVESIPRIPPRNAEQLRLSLLKEEFSEELIPALEAEDLVEIADAIADTIYVLLGTAVSYGIDLRPIWDEIHQSNMAKVGGGQREDGKVMKPEGWQPPDVAGLIEHQKVRDNLEGFPVNW